MLGEECKSCKDCFQKPIIGKLGVTKLSAESLKASIDAENRILVLEVLKPNIGRDEDLGAGVNFVKFLIDSSLRLSQDRSDRRIICIIGKDSASGRKLKYTFPEASDEAAMSWVAVVNYDIDVLRRAWGEAKESIFNTGYRDVADAAEFESSSAECSYEEEKEGRCYETPPKDPSVLSLADACGRLDLNDRQIFSHFQDRTTGLDEFSQIFSETDVTSDFSWVSLVVHASTGDTQAPPPELRDASASDVLTAKFSGFNFLVEVKFGGYKQSWTIPLLDSDRSRTDFDVIVEDDTLCIHHYSASTRTSRALLSLVFSDRSIASGYAKKFELEDSRYQSEDEDEKDPIEEAVDEELRQILALRRRWESNPRAKPLRWPDLMITGCTNATFVRTVYEDYCNIHALGLDDQPLMTLPEFKAATIRWLVDPSFEIFLKALAKGDS